MQTKDYEIDEGHKIALEAITYIGCALSLFGEVITIFVYVLLMDVRNEQAQIRLNLVSSIALAQLFFLTGVNATANQTVCMFVAVMIHFFTWWDFCWMLAEGVYLYTMVVLVFNTNIKIKLYYLLSWGLPALLITVCLVITASADGGVSTYLNDRLCWLSFNNNMVWAFAVPVFLVSTINMFILGRVLYEMFHLQSHAENTDNIRKAVKACMILFPLLGLTWMFGIFSVSGNNIAFQYLFTITNSSQGFFIFIFHCARSSEVRNLYEKKKERWNVSRSFNNNTSSPSNKGKTNRNSTETNDSILPASEMDIRRFGVKNQVSPKNI